MHGGKECKIPAALALPLNPGFGESAENVVFTLDSLKAVLQALEMLVDTTPDASSKVLKARQTSAADLPYHESLKGGSHTPDIPSRLDCLLCGRCSIPVLEMRPHVSAHVLKAQVRLPFSFGRRSGVTKAFVCISLFFDFGKLGQTRPCSELSFSGPLSVHHIYWLRALFFCRRWTLMQVTAPRRF